MSYQFQVNDSETGQPVEGAQCSITDRLASISKIMNLIRGLEGAGAVTDANGQCTIGPVYFSAVYYTVYKAGYETIQDTIPGFYIAVELVSTGGPVIFWLTVNSGVGGQVSIDGAAPVNGTTVQVEEGTVVNIEALPDDGDSFSHWLVDDVVSSSENPRAFIVDHDSMSIAAIFQPDLHAVTVQAGVGGSVTGSYSGATFSASPGTPAQFYAAEGGTIDAEAFPNAGETFDHWHVNGAVSTLSNPFSGLLIYNATTVAAVFSGQTPPPPPPPPPNGNGEYFEKRIAVYDEVPVKTESWETAKRDTKEVDVHTEGLVEARLNYTIHYTRGNDTGLYGRIRLNDEIIAEEWLNWNESFTSSVDVTGKLEEKNTIEIWHGSDALLWSEVVFSVELVLYYSEEPPTECMFPILPRFGPLKEAPLLCSIWDALTGAGILLKRAKRRNI